MNDITRTEEHAIARHKRITGSRIGTIMTGGPAGWDTLSDILHNPEPEKFFSLEDTPNMPEPMRRGLVYEPMARAKFFFRHDEYEVEQPMFCTPGNEVDEDLLGWIGISPDAILNPNGGLEIKVPSAEKHLAWKTDGIMPLEHLPQCALSMLVTGADHWWFCSMAPELPEEEGYFEIRLEREDIYLDHMKQKIRTFLEGHIAHKVFAGPTIEQEVIPVSGFPVINFDITDKAIAVLVERYSGMDEPKTTAEYAVVKAAQMDLMKRRTGIDKIYKKTTEEAKDFIAATKTEQKRLLALMESTETRLKALRTGWEDEQKRKKEEADAKEAARIEKIRDLIDWMNTGAITDLNGLTSELIRTQILTFEGAEITEDQYEEFFTEAQNAKTAMIVRAEEFLQKVIAREKEAARLETEQRELRERNEQLERENQERLVREESEQKERNRVKAIDDNLSMIKSSVLEALDGSTAEVEKIRETLAKIDIDFFEERADEAKALIDKTIKVVDKIIIDKRELDRLEAEQEAAETEAVEPEKVEQPEESASVDIEPEEISIEEQYLLDYTNSKNWKEIADLNWTTIQVMKVMRAYKEQP